MRDGFELALDHLGRKVGGLSAQVIYEDDQQKPEVGKQKTDKLIEPIASAFSPATSGRMSCSLRSSRRSMRRPS
jgi:ABC-type branched-subunit amino acid transport system substrate-binding protein